MTCLRVILARQRGRAWTVVRQPRESQMGESNLDNQQYPPIRKSRHTEAAAWIGHAHRGFVSRYGDQKWMCCESKAGIKPSPPLCESTQPAGNRPGFQERAFHFH